ncbi:MAG: HEAT repeat domain-containing protein [Phycisphaerales bacterium]|nr:HEAT repeat domain-containing protein [Phycisphaerales bacterium]
MTCTTRISSIVLTIGLATMATLAGCSESAKSSKWSSRGQSIVPTTTDPAGLVLSKKAAQQIPVQNVDLKNAAIDVLKQASIADDPLQRANAIEGLQPTTEPLREAVLRGLVDQNEGVRFVATLSIGTNNLCGISHLVNPLLEDPSGSVRAAAIGTLALCGKDIDLNPLAGFIFGDDATERANAALVLAELGNPSAIPLIRSGMGRDFKAYDPSRSRTIDLLMAESVVQLGDRTELEAIRAAMFAPPEHSELTALACQMLARLGDQVAAPNMLDLAAGDGPRQAGPELRLVAAASLAELAPDQVPVEMVLEYLSAEDPGVRIQVANTLKGLSDPRFEPQLAILLRDQDPYVQIATAAAILKMGEGLAAR